MGNRIKGICQPEQQEDDVPQEKGREMGNNQFFGPIDKMIDQRIVTLNNRKFKFFNKEKMIQKMQSSAVQLMLINNNCPKIIKEIHQVTFNLFENMIHSIEGLNRIRMPQIKVLDLGINRIVHFADLKKGYWANLVQLDLYGNKAIQIGAISRLASTKIEILSLEWSNYQEKYRIENIAYVSKFPSKCLKKISIVETRKISMKKIEDCLKKWHKQIMIEK